jgi:2-polyprenyl-3-methyl-5-hydroxy-6-metoxy-1,4-benzoquinol methylase
VPTKENFLEQPEKDMNEFNQNFDNKDYFVNLYGAKDDLGNPSQTKIDKLRDGLLVKMYEKYGETSLSSSKVVDIGCGYGWLLDYFEGAQVVCGSDISDHAIEIAAKRKPNRNFKVADIQDGVAIETKFDLVLAINVIEHLPNPEAGIDSICKALVPGGIALVHLPTINNAFNKWEYKYLYDSDPTHIYRPKGKTIREMFEKNGMKTLRDSFLPHYPAWLTRLIPVHPAYLAVYKKN